MNNVIIFFPFTFCQFHLFSSTLHVHLSSEHKKQTLSTGIHMQFQNVGLIFELFHFCFQSAVSICCFSFHLSVVVLCSFLLRTRCQSCELISVKTCSFNFFTIMYLQKAQSSCTKQTGFAGLEDQSQ